jgi:GTPase SAR1 family protein
MPTIMRAKVAIVGDTKSGKTALTQMFLTGNYPKVYNMVSSNHQLQPL